MSTLHHGFPVLSADYLLRQYRVDGIKHFSLYGLKERSSVDINEALAFVISHCTGENSVDDIAGIAGRCYETSSRTALESVNACLAPLLGREVMRLSSTAVCERSFPLVAEMRGIVNKVHLKITNACNLRCVHCSADAGRPIKEELSREEVFALVDQLHTMMVPQLVINGGEATLVEYLPELIAYVREKPIRAVLMTNGTMITEEYGKRLSDAGLSHANISIDGAVGSTHDRFRGMRGSFRKAIEAIEILVSQGISVETTSMVYEGNYHEVDEMMAIGKRLGVTLMKFMPIIPMKRGAQCDFMTSFQHYAHCASKFVGTAGSRFSKKGLLGMSSRNTITRCGAGNTELAVMPDGDVIPCPNWEGAVLGSIRGKPLIEIYNSSEKMRAIMRTTRIEGSECASCQLLDYCHGGCPMVSYAFYGDHGRCDPVNKIDVLAHLHSIGISAGCEHSAFPMISSTMFAPSNSNRLERVN